MGHIKKGKSAVVGKSKRGQLSKPTNSKGGQNFTVNLSEKLSFNDPDPNRNKGTGGGNKKNNKNLTAQSLRGKLRFNKPKFGNKIKTPEQQSFDSANLSKEINRRQGKSAIFFKNNSQKNNLGTQTSKANSLGGQDFSIGLSETLKIRDKPLTGVLTVGNLPPPPSDNPTPPPDIIDAFLNFFGFTSGGSGSPASQSPDNITIIQAPPATLPPPLGEDDDQVLFPPFDVTGGIGLGGGEGTEQENGEGFIDSLLKNPENLVLGGTALIAGIVGLRG